MDGYIAPRNNSRLFGGNGRVTGLLVQAVIGAMAEPAKKITPLTESKTSQIENPRKGTLQCGPHCLIESQSLGNEEKTSKGLNHPAMKMEMLKEHNVAVKAL